MMVDFFYSFFVGIISLAILSRMKKRFIKEIVRMGIIVGLAVVTLFSFQITSMVLGTLITKNQTGILVNNNPLQTSSLGERFFH